MPTSYRRRLPLRTRISVSQAAVQVKPGVVEADHQSLVAPEVGVPLVLGPGLHPQSVDQRWVVQPLGDNDSVPQVLFPVHVDHPDLGGRREMVADVRRLGSQRFRIHGCVDQQVSESLVRNTGHAHP
jgi:hypothetical protein